MIARFIFRSFRGLFFGFVFVSFFDVVLGTFGGPFWLRSGVFFSYFPSQVFYEFSDDSGSHFGFILAPFCAPKSTSGALGDEKADL